MKKLLPLLAVAAAACGARPVIGPSAPAPAPQPYVVPADANLLVSISEAVGSPDEDRPTRTKVLLNGREAGETETGPRSKEKRWGLKLSPGNYLLRLEKWEENPPEQWSPLPPDWQPRERFVLVKEGMLSEVIIKFYDGGRRHDYKIERHPLGASVPAP